MRRSGLRCVLTYFEYAPHAPQPRRRLTKAEFAAVHGISPCAPCLRSAILFLIDGLGLVGVEMIRGDSQMLSGKQRRYLRGLGHHLDPVVQVGKQGLTASVVSAVDGALEEHELVKVRIGTECPEEREDVAARLAPQVGAEVAQVLGRTALIYRRHPKRPTITLPACDAADPDEPEG